MQEKYRVSYYALSGVRTTAYIMAVSSADAITAMIAYHREELGEPIYNVCASKCSDDM